jgi:hypothetical protein
VKGKLTTSKVQYAYRALRYWLHNALKAHWTLIPDDEHLNEAEKDAVKRFREHLFKAMSELDKIFERPAGVTLLEEVRRAQ